MGTGEESRDFGCRCFLENWHSSACGAERFFSADTLTENDTSSVLYLKYFNHHWFVKKIELYFTLFVYEMNNNYKNNEDVSSLMGSAISLAVYLHGAANH